MKDFKEGLMSGIPIGLGYLSVSFTFGIMAVGMGLSWWQATIISMLTVTSAGQLAGIGTMIHPGLYMEMLISQLTINIRYSFMSISIGQKADSKFKGIYRWLLGFMMTDEIFGVASSRKSVSRSFFAGLSVFPYLGWALGTLIGALLGEVLPGSLLSALGIALYAMFIAIVVPEMKKSKPVIVVVLIAIILSCGFKYLPVLQNISAGIAITICGVVAALVGAVFFPIEEAES
ncbi:MAG: AzlC family ABC transporter permease [Lachnospiraceae bacterium]|nr:AzlC family ABC transporter permease [Lachnospiraceae bacterium]